MYMCELFGSHFYDRFSIKTTSNPVMFVVILVKLCGALTRFLLVQA